MARKKLLIVIASIVLAFLFYWFQIRPAIANRECASEIADLPEVKPNEYRVFFEHCLHKYGL